MEHNGIEWEEGKYLVEYREADGAGVFCSLEWHKDAQTLAAMFEHEMGLQLEQMRFYNETGALVTEVPLMHNCFGTVMVKKEVDVYTQYTNGRTFYKSGRVTDAYINLSGCGRSLCIGGEYLYNPWDKKRTAKDNMEMCVLRELSLSQKLAIGFYGCNRIYECKWLNPSEDDKSASLYVAALDLCEL